MKVFFSLAVVSAVALGVDNTFAAIASQPVYEADKVEHGGGCRKSSPPGQCCHKDSRTGTVHCH